MKSIEGNGPVPRLRFPEFREAGPWEMKRLGEVSGMQAGTFIAAAGIYAEARDGLNPCYGGNGLRGYTASHTHVGRYPLIGRQGAYCGNVQFAEGKFYATEHAIVATPYHGVTEKFLYYLLIKADLARLATGQAQPGLSVTLLNSVELPLPSYPEQQKVADCLSSLDDLIRAEGGRLAALKDHKRGLMQRLFPAPGETTPRLRFPEFRDVEPWEVKRLGDDGVANFVRDRIAAANIPPGHYVSTVNLLSNFEGLSQKAGPPPSGSAIAYCAGDILMSNIRPYLRKIWVADRSGGASNDVIVVRPGKRIVQTFLGHFLMSDRFISYIMDGAKGVKMPRGDLEQIQSFEVPMCTKPEQQKIADCLTSLDDLIRVQGVLVETLNAHKRGLMQQLFPQEVVG